MRYRLYVVPLLAVFLPCAIIGLIGYQWLQLERETRAKRGRESAEAEAVRIRGELVSHLSAVTQEIARTWIGLPSGRPAFAPTPPVPELVASAYVLTPAGKLLYPDYQGAYLEAARVYESAAAGGKAGELPVKAAALLSLGRLALAAKRYGEAESNAQQIIQCCSAARDEYGLSLAQYAAEQMAAAWEAKGRLRANFPRLAAQLGDLLQRGVIGHPNDLHEIAALAKRIGGGPEAPLLLRQAEEQTNRVRAHVAMGRRLERWVSGADLNSARSSAFTLHTLSMEGRPSLAGVYQAGDRLLVTLFAAGPLRAWVAAEAARGGHFDAVLTSEDEYLGNSILRTAMLPEAPGFELSLRPRESGPAIERRQRLFAGALAAAVLLVLLVGCFAFRDVSREVRLASLRSTFVSSVTHELKTPLTSIRLLAETLRLKRTRDPAAADQMLGAIADESERLARLVDNVLSFSRIENDANPCHQTPIDLTEAVDDAVRRFQYILQQGEFRLQQESDGKPLRVLADAEALSQALLNLLDNAVKYSGLSREILLGVHRRGKEVEIRVTDQGIGVPPAEQRRIFESFYRAPGAARETTGAGLGLALVQHFAEAHGGRAAVASGPGRGSAFSLWLPLMENDGQDSDR
jgi:signal transduction histidine kinase